MADSIRLKAARAKFRASARQKGDPLPAGDPRRLTDARCAWRKMTEEQRKTFLDWLLPLQYALNEYTPNRSGLIEATLNEWSSTHPPETGGPA